MVEGDDEGRSSAETVGSDRECRDQDWCEPERDCNGRSSSSALASDAAPSKRDEEVQAFSSDRAYQRAHRRRLPWGARTGVFRIRTPMEVYRLVQVLGKDAVPVMDQKPVRMFFRQRLAEPLQGPFSTWMRLSH